MLTTRTKDIKFRLTSAADLLKMKQTGAFSVWAFNRDLDEDRVARMYDAQVKLLKEKRPFTLFMPTPVYVCACADASLVLVDGQHRLAVLELLAKRPDVRAAEIELMLCVVNCGAGQTVDDVFIQINSGTPVPSAYYDKKVRVLLSQYVAFLETEYPLSVSRAPRPQRPNFNVTSVRDEMSSLVAFRDAVIDGRISLELLCEATREENRVETAIPVESRRKIPESVLLRAERTGFYLGLRDGWSVAVALRAAHADDAF
jgi:hypothetical protein